MILKFKDIFFQLLKSEGCEIIEKSHCIYTIVDRQIWFKNASNLSPFKLKAIALVLMQREKVKKNIMK